MSNKRKKISNKKIKINRITKATNKAIDKMEETFSKIVKIMRAKKDYDELEELKMRLELDEKIGYMRMREAEMIEATSKE